MITETTLNKLFSIAWLNGHVRNEALKHIEWLFDLEAETLKIARMRCKNCGRFVDVPNPVHVLGALCSDECRRQNYENYL